MPVTSFPLGIDTHAVVYLGFGLGVNNLLVPLLSYPVESDSAYNFLVEVFGFGLGGSSRTANGPGGSCITDNCFGVSSRTAIIT